MKSGIRAFFLSLLIYSLIINPVLADTASLLPNAVQQFFDNNGNPLNKGTVTTYDAGTSTLRTTWKDSAETLPNTNPIVLDAGGKAIIYGSGTYRQVVKDRNGNLIWDAVTAPGGGGSSPTDVGDGNLVGTILPWSGLTAPNQYVFGYGQEILRATYPEFYTAVTQQLNVICTSASNILTGLADTSQVKIGSAVELPLCVASGTTVTAKTFSTITLSNPSSVSINSVGTFYPWGNGDGSTTFNVPDLRGYVPVGRDNMGGTPANRISTTNCGGGITPDALGAVCGSDSTTLASTNLPASIPYTDPGHTHGSNAPQINGSLGAAGAAAVSGATATINSATIGITINPGSPNTPISRIQPSLTMNYIVKVTPDTSTSIATGVWSIGGMSGVIACGDGILCTGNIISSSLTAGSPLFITSNNITISGSTLSRVNDTNVTLTLSGTPSTALINSVGMTLGWTGTLSGTRGGTGVNNGSNTITVAGNFAVTTNGGTLSYGAASKTLTINKSITLEGTDATTWTGPSTNATLAALNITDQTLTGGANVTSASLGTKSSGTTTIDCGTSPLQYLTNGGAFTLAAPANDGSCIVRSLNNASAGTITFSGFTVGSNTGDTLGTTNGNAYAIQIWRINGVSRYLISAYQ